MSKKTTLADLKPGESAVITDLSGSAMGVKFCEMGCLPGCTVELCYRAPFNGPLCLKIKGNMLAVRKEDASAVIVKK